MKKIRILIVDDHLLIRAGLRHLLDGMGGIEVVGEAGDGQRALEVVKSKTPDVVLMDITMEGMNGLEATSRVTRDFPNVGVVILTMHTSDDYVRRALRAGARGYVLKDAPPEELESAITAVARGDTYLTPSVSGHIVADFLRGLPAAESSLDRLTPRQRQVLQLIAEGNRTKDIARQLKISPRTVETHRAQLMDELEIRDVTGLVRFAVRMGLVTTEK